MELLRSLGNFTGASREWIIARINELVGTVTVLSTWSAAVLVLGLTLSYITGMQWFLPLLAIAYLALAVFLVASKRTLEGTQLLIASDLVLDLIEGKVTVTQLEDGAPTFEMGSLDFRKLQELATLQIYGRILFNIALFAMLIMAYYSYVRIWDFPGFVGLFLFLSILVGFMTSPWGRKSPLSAFTPIIYLAWGLLAGIPFLFRTSELLWETGPKLAREATRIEQIGEISWIVPIILMGILFMLPKGKK